jgi:sulfoxide reductase heme-binding subunit YedZ
MLADVRKRPFITAGTAGLLAMVPLAITSTSGWIRRLGGGRWQALHRLIYFSTAAGVVHYYWLVKSDVRAPVAYGTVFVALMALRVWVSRRQPAASAVRRPVRQSVTDR